MRRRRLHPPWFPGFRALAAFFLLLALLFGFYHALAVFTRFERAPAPPPPPAARK